MRRLAIELDALRTVVLTPRGGGTDVHDLASRIRRCNTKLCEVDQVTALAAAREVALAPSQCVTLLKRASVEDADEAAGLATAAGELVSILSGCGVHQCPFATRSTSLRLCYQQQSTGTHGRVWRAAHVAACACEDGWGGVSVVDERRLIEIGCGTGAVGLACAALGASSVWLTDIDEGALALTRSNVALNGLESRVAHVGAFDVMDPSAWPGDAAQPAAAAPGERFGCVIAADGGCAGDSNTG